MAQAARAPKRARRVVEDAQELVGLEDVVHQPGALVAEAEEVEAQGVVALERLAAPESSGGANLTNADLKILRENGICCVDTVRFLPMKKLTDLKGIGDAKAMRMKAASVAMVPLKMMSAAEFLTVRRNMVQLSTGSAQLDGLLQGGIETGGITEIFGEFRCGKTQLCHTLCVTCQLPLERGGADRKALYIDTEGTFRPERLAAISQRFGLHEEDVLNNVTYARAYNCDHQNQLLIECASLFCENQYGLLVIDSATGLFRTDYCGRSELADRQQSLNQFLRKLQRIADEHGCAVVITNQVMAKPDSGAAAYMGPQIAPVGGHIIAHASQTRLMLRKGKGELRVCKIFDSPSLPEGEATFAITEGGVADGMEQDKGRKGKGKGD